MQGIYPNSNSIRFGSIIILIATLAMASGFKSAVDNVKKIPVLKVNFYLMGIDQVDERITIGVGDNVRYLNEEFEGQIIFELDELFQDYNGSYLPDIHADVLNGRMDFVEDLISPIEKHGNINVFVFPTYCPEGSDRALTGFTPIMKPVPGKISQKKPRI